MERPSHSEGHEADREGGGGGEGRHTLKECAWSQAVTFGGRGRLQPMRKPAFTILQL